ncbi:SRPBCC family protein [Gordonia rubripertincta]|jgi:uncharacterized protein YndB with AHSA1/START domain|uniref:SRPBCC family protein n=1 Tax=Gordonia rubripertincta TaxID=36822 RepID=A0ABT4MVD6_GORRU|nr:SRPBCC family protein [Gordonia rubripertincta]MCZ4550956.1 SRPBCC family protein [Gordonia rubripertincta]
MTTSIDTERDLVVSRIIRAPRAAVWSAWTEPAKFEQWWVPAPAECRVAGFDLHPGGAFRTEIRERGGDFSPHIDGCFLAVDHLERIVFTTALVGGWRPAPNPFMTATITFADHPEGTEYTATAMHKDITDRNTHDQLGFQDGWGTVTRQLAQLAEA